MRKGKVTSIHFNRFFCIFEPFAGLRRTNHCRSTRTRWPRPILISMTRAPRAFRRQCAEPVWSPCPWARFSYRRPIRSTKTSRSPAWTSLACSPATLHSCSPTGTCDDSCAIRRRTWLPTPTGSRWD